MPPQHLDNLTLKDEIINAFRPIEQLFKIMNIVFSLSCVKYFKGTSFRDRRIRENRMSGGDSELGIGDSLFRSIAHQRLW